MSEGGWAPITRRAAVTVDDESLDIADLVLLGILAGDWPAFERQVALGLALERAHPDRVTAEDVRREATTFRYAHGLISAADFRRWLEAHQMTVGELSQVLRRRLLRQDDRDTHSLPRTDADVIRALLAEAFCDGVLARLAEHGVDQLVAGRLVPSPLVGDDQLEQAMSSMTGVRAPVLSELGGAEVRARLSRLLSLRLALEQLRDDVADPSAIVRRLKQHALGWTELAGEELRFTREGAAREARLQITADGHTPAAVAERAAVAVLDRRLLVGEAPAAAGVSFAAAAVGEVVGPWEEDGQWRVLRLRAKAPPSVENRSLRSRAIDELLRERIRRYAAGRTVRHVEL